MHPWIVLFDIDGTLLNVEHHFSIPLLRRILDRLHIDYPGLENDSFSGRTDYDILTSFLVNHQFDKTLYNKLKSVYIEDMVKFIKSEHVNRKPYIDEAIQYLDQNGSYIGLLTGNFPETAYAKLKAAGIKYSFQFGAFGEYDRNRNHLPEIALETVHKKLGIEPEPEKFIIIGDTPRDIECAKYAGMKSVAVATGRFDIEELKPDNPDLLLNNLSNPQIWFPKLTGIAQEKEKSASGEGS